MEMKYPKKFKSKNDSLVVEFTSLTEGIVIVPGDQGFFPYKAGDVADGWIPHTNTNQWEEVVEMTKLEELEKQVAEMQATIASMRLEALVPKQWEPQGGTLIVSYSGTVCYGNSSNSSRLFGTEYQTKEQAEWASKQMRKFNRLLCYVAEHTDGIPQNIHIFTDIHNCMVTIDMPFQIKEIKILNAKIQSGEVVL